MQWKFWRPRQSEEGIVDSAGGKLSGPKDLPQQVGGYLVIHEKLDPDWVWSLKCVVRRYPNRRTQFDFRVFDPAKAKQAGIKVANFRSLDAQPDLILYQGNYSKYVHQAQFDKAQTIDKAA
jgi:hypothetical protein